MWTIMCNFWNFFPFSENVDYHMQFLEFLSLLHKCGLSYAISKISFSSPKTWTIIIKFYNLFLFSKNVDYHMKFLEFLSLRQKRGLSYAISGISFPSFASSPLEVGFDSLIQHDRTPWTHPLLTTISLVTIPKIFFKAFGFWRSFDAPILPRQPCL